MGERRDEHEERLEKSADLDFLGRDLTSLALKGELSPVYLRKDIIEKIKAFLNDKIYFILVGKPGTGKNAVVYGMICEMVEERAYHYYNFYINKENQIQNYIPQNLIFVYECEPSAFERDCLYAHEFETKFRKVIENCKKKNAILFINNIHLAVYAGCTGENLQQNVANYLKGVIEGNAVFVFGATTPEGYNLLLGENPSFTNKFVKIDVPETTIEETCKILKELKNQFESLYEVKIDDNFLEYMIETSHYLFPWRSFPGKAFELLKEVISLEKGENNTHLKTDAVDRYIIEKTGLREFLVSRDKKIKKEEIKKFFTERIFEQDSAIDTICDTIMRFKAGLNNPNQPISVLLFIGPTGVGKTELAKLLAEYLFGSEKKLLRFDMSEYISNEGQEKLIGSRFQREPGLLISSARANPFAVYLFDEIEKSTQPVFDIFLQIFGEGRITDPHGETVYLNNSIIIMTSNIGADLYKKSSLGFERDPNENIKNIEKEIDRRLNEIFRPEFINRISKIVFFKPLSKEGIKKVARKEIAKLKTLKGLKNYNIEVDESVMELLFQKGYNPQYGARPMQRAIQEIIVNPVAEKLVSEEIPEGSTLKVMCGSDNKVFIEVKSSFN